MARSVSYLIKVILGLAILLAAVSTTIFMLTPNLSRIAKNQLAAIHDNDLQKAYAMTTSEFQQQTSLKQFREYIGLYPVLQKNKKFRPEETLVEGNFGYLSATLEASDDSQMRVEYQFVKENKKWQIQAIRLSTVPE